MTLINNWILYLNVETCILLSLSTFQSTCFIGTHCKKLYSFCFTVPPPNRAYLRSLIHNGDLVQISPIPSLSSQKARSCYKWQETLLVSQNDLAFGCRCDKNVLVNFAWTGTSGESCPRRSRNKTLARNLGTRQSQQIHFYTSRLYGNLIIIITFIHITYSYLDLSIYLLHWDITEDARTNST